MNPVTDPPPPQLQPTDANPARGVAPVVPVVLVVNAGSSSLKFALYPRDGAALAVGQIEGLQAGGRAVLRRAGLPDQPLAGPLETATDRYATALQALQQAVAGASAGQAGVAVQAVAHRIVHGGSVCRAPAVLDAALLARLEALSPLAPLHQPHNLAGVRALQGAWPGLPQIGCFDTAFHADLPEVEQRYALPRALHEQGLRRYGFHGLSYQYLTQALRPLTPRLRGRALLAHLGSGASLCATVDGRSVATTMGFSTLDGLVMGSRCGALDPGVLLHLWREGWSLDQVERLLYRESGLLGVSGTSADMRALHAAATGGDAAAQQAIDLFSHRLRREAGALVAALGGLDLLVFSGGIGEHDAAIRATLAADLGHLGVRLDAAAHAAARGDAIAPIHAADSAVDVWVVPTDEGRVAAQAAWALLDGAAPSTPTL